MARGRRGGAVRRKSASLKKSCESDADLSQVKSDNEDRADESPSSVRLRKRRSSGNSTKLEPAAKVLRSTRQSARRSRLPVSEKDFDSDSAVDSPSLSCKDNNVCGSEVAETDECHKLTENDKSSALEDIKKVEYENQREHELNTSGPSHLVDIPLQEVDSEIHNVEAITVGASYGVSSPESDTTKTADATVKENNNAEGADQALDNPDTLLDSKSFNIKESDSDDAMEVSESAIMDSERLKAVNVGLDEESTSPDEIDERKKQNIEASVADKIIAKIEQGIIELDKSKPVCFGTGDMPDTPTKLAECEPQKSENVTANKVLDGGEACIEESECLKPAEESFDKKCDDDDVTIIKDLKENEGDLVYDVVEIHLSDSELENELNLEEADTLSETDNDTQPEVDEQDQDIQTSTCSDKSDSSHITGLSFIIGIKGKPTSADGKAVQPTFDCVLCNEDFISYTGATMHSHVKTRSHILNVMKLHSYCMYKQYESNKNIETEKLHSIVAGYEKTIEKQHLTMASEDAHTKIRKDVQVHIEKLRNKLDDEKGLKNQNVTEKIYPGRYEKTKEKQPLTMATAGHAKIRKDVQVHIENIRNKLDDEKDSKNRNVTEKIPPLAKYADFREWYIKEIKELVKLQANRTPNCISLVVDTRDKNVVLEPKGKNQRTRFRQQKFQTRQEKSEDFDVIQIAENDLEASYDVIKKHSSFNRGTVYVLLGGNYSFMKKVQLPDCKKHNCKNTVNELPQDGFSPVEQAFSLHKKILNNTKNDIVIFANMIPITYGSFHFHAYSKIGCKHKRSVEPPSGKSSESSKYKKMIRNYNEFARIHAEEMGFFPWITDRSTQTRPSPGLSQGANSKDGFNFSQEFLKVRRQQILCDIGRLKKILKTKSSQIKPEAVSTISKSLQARLGEPKKSERNLKHDRVVILTDTRYEFFLQDLATKNVQVVAQDNMNIEEVKKYISDETARSLKTLWLFVTGIFCLGRNSTYKKCRNRCNLPIQYLTPHEDILDIAYTSSFISKIKVNMFSVVGDIKKSLSAGDDFAVMPPIPLVIKNETCLSHNELHFKMRKDSLVFVTGEKYLPYFEIYSTFCVEVANAAIRQCDVNCSAVENYLKNVYHPLEILHNASGDILPPPYDVWKGSVKKFIDNVSVPSDAECRKDDDIDIDDTVNLKPSRRIVIEEADNNDHYKKPSEREKNSKNTSALISRSVLNDNPKQIRQNFDRLVFLGTKNLFQCSLIFNKVFLANLPPQLYWYIEYPVNWELFDEQRKNWMNKKNILYIYIPDLSMLGTGGVDALCSTKKCKTDLNYMVVAPVECRMSYFEMIVKDMKSLCVSGSEFIVTSPFPRICIQTPKSANKDTHSLLHKVVTHDCNPLLLEGSKSGWNNAAEDLVNKWTQVFNTHSSSDIKKASSFQSNDITDWKLANLYPDFESDLEAVWIEKFRLTINDTVQTVGKHKSQKDLKENRTKLGKRDKKRSDSQDFPVAEPSSKNISRQVQEYSSDPYERDQQFTEPYFSPSAFPYSQLTPLRQWQPDMGYNSEMPVGNYLQNFTNASQGYSSIISQPDHPGGSVVYNYPILPSNTDNIVSSAVTAQYVDTTQVACDALNPDKGNNLPHSVFADEYNIATLDLYSQNFISALSDILTSLNNQTVFKKVLFVGKGSLIRPLRKINVESDVVVHSLEKVTGQTVLSVLKKIGPISRDTVCCLVFDMEVITEEVAASCCKTCEYEIPVQLTVIKSLKYPNRQKQSKRISHYLSHIQNFVQGLSDHIPVIGLPLYPTTLHCFAGQLYANHELMHTVIKYGCIVRVSTQLWHKNIQALTAFWNDLLRETHRHFPSAALVARFIDEQITMFPIIERVDDVTSHRSEPAIWMLLTEFIILSLVSPKSSSYDMPVSNIRPGGVTGPVPLSKSKSSSYDMPVSNIRPGGVTHPVPLSKSKSSSYDMPVSNIRPGGVTHPVPLSKSKSSSYDMPVSNIRPGVTHPVPLMSMNVEPLPYMSATRDTAAMMTVLNVSDSIPKEFFAEFFTAVDLQAEIFDKRYPDNYVVSFMKRSTAELVAYKLHDCQIGDTTLQAKIVGNKDEIPELNKALFADITSVFDEVYLTWKSCIYNNIAKKLSAVIDVMSFKTKECPGNCEGFDKCFYYHNYSDKRRNPVMFNYSQMLCSRARDSVGMCFLCETCDSSHNKYEQLFHPTIFQAVSCPSNNSQNECEEKPLCKFAHIDTPEMFFTSSWEDLLVFGTHNTLSYFAGAIRGLKKIASTHADYKVVLISPSREFLDVAKKAVAGVIADHRVSVATIGEDWINRECQVFLSVPASLENYQIQIFNDRVGGALIVDNVKKLLENIDDSYGFHKFINQVQLVSGGSAIVNKVFVSSHYDADVSGLLSRYFGLKLKEVKDRANRMKSNEGSVRKSADSQGRRKAEASKPGKFMPSSTHCSYDSDYSHKAMTISSNSSDEDQSSWSPTKNRCAQQKKRNVPRVRSRSRSRSRPRLKANSRPSESRINDSQYKPTISELLQSNYATERDQPSTSQHFEDNSVQSWRTGSNTETQSWRTGSNTETQSWRTGSNTETQSWRTGSNTETQSWRTGSNTETQSWRTSSNTELQSEDRNVQVDSRVTSSDTSELRLKFGPHLYEEYMKAERALKHKIDEEYKVYQDVSELHPDYEIYYEDFMSKYRTTHHNKGERHKETLWNQFWRVKFEEIKKQDYEQQKETLLHEYETKATRKTFSNEPSNSGKKWVDPEKFSVEGTLNLLEQVCNNMGMLGAAILAMVKSSRELGITTRKALDIFTDSENINLLKMVLEKLETWKLSAPRNMLGTYCKTIEWTVKLMEVAITGLLPKEYIDLNGIARASVGKDLNFIVNMIKTALFCQGIMDPSKEKVNELYLKICSLHFNMSSEG